MEYLPASLSRLLFAQERKSRGCGEGLGGAQEVGSGTAGHPLSTPLWYIVLQLDSRRSHRTCLLWSSATGITQLLNLYCPLPSLMMTVTRLFPSLQRVALLTSCSFFFTFFMFVLRILKAKFTLFSPLLGFLFPGQSRFCIMSYAVSWV